MDIKNALFGVIKQVYFHAVNNCPTSAFELHFGIFSDFKLLSVKKRCKCDFVLQISYIPLSTSESRKTSGRREGTNGQTNL